MQRWKLILSYDGTPFRGWQIQPHLPTVQGTLALALHHLTGETVLPQGSGRTDTGVHALAQVASFDLAARIPAANLQRALNRALPQSIRVLSAEHAAPDFHARHSAIGKTYEYRIFARVPAPGEPPVPAPGDPPENGRTERDGRDQICPPTLAPYVWDCPWPISLDVAQRCAQHILGVHDFTSFAASDPDQNTRRSDGEPRSNTRTVRHSCWHRAADGLLLYRVTGTGFLHHMVRNLVGTFVDAACGRIEPGSIPAVLAACKRSAAGPTAPATGLFLHHVEYPEESRP